jgi:polyhydroxybutyrate depolymerase
MLVLRKSLSSCLSAALIGIGVTSDVSAAPVCPAATVAAGNYSYSFNHGGRTRSYRVHIPSGLDRTRPAPVVLSMHGLYSTSQQQQAISGWDQTSNTYKFVVAYPQGYNNRWNVVGFNPTIDDTGFLKAVVDHLSARVRIAPNRIYLSGISLGGGLSHRMACEQADYYAAAAPFVFHLWSSPTLACNPSRAIAVTEYAGLDDTLVRYAGGRATAGGQPVTFMSAQLSFRTWAALNGCTGSPITTFSSGRNRVEEFQTCQDGVKVGLASLTGGHGALTSSALGSPTRHAWTTFLSQFSAPGQPADACAP